MKRFVSPYVVSLFGLFVLVSIALLIGGLPSIAAIATLPFFGVLVRNAVRAQIVWDVPELLMFTLRPIKSIGIAGLVFVVATILAAVIGPESILPLWSLFLIASAVQIFAKVVIYVMDMGISESLFNRFPMPHTREEAQAVVNASATQIAAVWIVAQVLGLVAFVAAGLPLFGATICIMIGLYVMLLFRNILGDGGDVLFVRQQTIARWVSWALALDAVFSLTVLKGSSLVHDLGRGFIIVQVIVLLVVAAKFYWQLYHPEVSEPEFQIEFIGYIDADDLK